MMPIRRLTACAIVLASAPACGAPAPTASVEPSAPAVKEPRAAPNWVIIAPDSMRADRVGALPDGSIPAPNLTQIAREGVTFSHAYSQSGWTSPALASLLTGQYPSVLRFGGGGQAAASWAPGSRTLPEILKLYGYQTAAFWGNSIPSEIPAFFVGFDSSTTRPRSGTMTDGTDVVDWIEHKARPPFFALVHDVDFTAYLEAAGPRTGAQAYLDGYDTAVGQYDGTVGKVRAALDHAGFTDDTVIVVTSNHGLDFFGHDASVAHGTLYDPVLHIPFVIDDPASPLRGVVNDTMIQGIDLAPTILARSGIPLAATMDGHSLLSLLGYAGAYTATTVYSMTSAMDASLRTPEYKLIVCRADCCGAAKAPADGPCRGAEVYKLFDLVADPEERHDIAAERPAVVAEYADQLRTWHHQQNAITPGGTAFPIDPAQKKMLQERGYWDLMFPNGDTPDTHAPPTAPEHPLPPAR